MTSRIGIRNALGAAIFACALFFTVSNAGALDANDVKNLVRSNVGEDVIVTMIVQSNPIAMSEGDADDLRALGASETLIAVLRNSSSQRRVEPVGEYVLSDGSTAPMVQAAPSGTVTYVDPSTGVTYMEPEVVYTTPPTVIYETPPTVVYEAAPTYVYPYPTYRSGPSFSIGIGVGGGRKYHGRHRRR